MQQRFSLHRRFRAIYDSRTMTLYRALLIGSALVTVAATQAVAHFRLIAPASWIQENQLGDPQKAGPCGGTSADAGKPTGAVTTVKGGEKLHLKVAETV